MTFLGKKAGVKKGRKVHDSIEDLEESVLGTTKAVVEEKPKAAVEEALLQTEEVDDIDDDKLYRVILPTQYVVSGRELKSAIMANAQAQ